MSGKLVAEEGPMKGLVLALEEGSEWVVGRDPEACQLVLEDPATSRRHVLLRKTAAGTLLENLSRTNPALVNDEKVAEPQLLRNGDTLKIGRGLYRFYDVAGDIIAPEREEIVTVGAGGASTPRPQPTREAIERDTIFEEEKGEAEAPGIDLHPPGRWLLKVIAGPNNGAEFSMLGGHTYTLGTDATSCDIVFHDISVSRQHARVQVSDDETLTLEDLQSRNGTLVDGNPIEEKTQLASNNLVTIGTTAFVVIDREGERETLVSPPLSTFGRIVQDQATLQATQAAVQQVAGQPTQQPVAQPATPVATAPIESREEKTGHAVGGLLLLAIITGLFVIVGVGVSTLFRSQEVPKEAVDVTKPIAETLAPYPLIQSSFNKGTGTLLLVGHVATNADKSRILYNLKSMPFIKTIDDNLIVDELVWQEANQVLAKNPKWRGITVTSPAPGRFVLSGYLKSRAEAQELSEYLSLNFEYPELLEKRLFVEEEVAAMTRAKLQEKNIVTVNVDASNGEIVLSGNVSKDKTEALKEVIDALKAVPGVRAVKDATASVEPSDTVIDLTGEYEVTGFSHGGSNVSVVINGRILTKGDLLDGMKITNITPGTIYLEKQGFKYKVDFKK